MESVLTAFTDVDADADVDTKTNTKDVDNTLEYKLKKGTVRRKFFECGFEAGQNCTIAAIKNSLNPDQVIKYSDMIKFLNELTISKEAPFKEFDKIKHKHLTIETLKKKHTRSKPAKIIEETEETTTVIIDDIKPDELIMTLTQIPSVSDDTSEFNDLPDENVIFNDSSSVLTDATDITTATDISTDEPEPDKVYITFPAINTGESIDTINPTAAKKRGRKRKTFIHRVFYNPNYIALWEEICNSDRVLIDCVGNVYTYDMENPKYLGKYQLDGKIDTTKPYTPPDSNFDHNYTYGISGQSTSSTHSIKST
jgi:hypothetical protein